MNRGPSNNWFSSWLATRWWDKGNGPAQIGQSAAGRATGPDHKHRFPDSSASRWQDEGDRPLKNSSQIVWPFFWLRTNAIPHTSVPRGGTTLPKFTCMQTKRELPTARALRRARSPARLSAAVGPPAGLSSLELVQAATCTSAAGSSRCLRSRAAVALRVAVAAQCAAG